MDPLNNPTPTPTPPTPPTPEPAPSPIPEPNVAPMFDPIAEPSPMPEPNPVSNPTPPPVVPAPVTTPPPVNPIINPSNNGSINSTFKPELGEIPATDPIMTPEPAKAPDPVEEELKAPMKAAGPVPGSIGSAVSGPASESNMDIPAGDNPFDNLPKERTQSVSFNDPAMAAPSPMGDNVMPAKKPQNKTTLIALIAVAAVIVVVLIVVLVMQLMGDSGSSASNQGQNDSSNSQTTPDEDETSDNDSDTPVSYTDTLSCTRNMTSSEIILFNDAVSGAVNISAEFNDDNELDKISLVKTVVYSDEDKTSNEPIEAEMHEESAKNLTSENAGVYYLPIDSEGELMLDLDSIQTHYKSLEFSCELL